MAAKLNLTNCRRALGEAWRDEEQGVEWGGEGVCVRTFGEWSVCVCVCESVADKVLLRVLVMSAENRDCSGILREFR